MVRHCPHSNLASHAAALAAVEALVQHTAVLASSLARAILAVSALDGDSALAELATGGHGRAVGAAGSLWLERMLVTVLGCHLGYGPHVLASTWTSRAAAGFSGRATAPMARARMVVMAETFMMPVWEFSGCCVFGLRCCDAVLIVKIMSRSADSTSFYTRFWLSTCRF